MPLLCWTVRDIGALLSPGRISDACITNAKHNSNRMAKTPTTFAVRCYVGNRRLKTDKLTKDQARCLLQCAKHLATFLESSYGAARATDPWPRMCDVPKSSDRKWAAAIRRRN
jgi:hypothetical protein